MSHDHGGHEHGGHDHGGHADHGEHGGHGGHDEHGHGGHAEHWGDYNAQPPGPSPLPPVHPGLLVVFGLALAALLGAIVNFSFKLADAKIEHGDTEHIESGPGKHDDHKHGH